MVQHQFLSALLLVSGFTHFASAQTYSDCFPLKQSCPNDPGLQKETLTLDFTQTKSLPAEWTTENQGNVAYAADGAKLSVAKPKDSLNIISNFYVLFGSFEFKLKVAPGAGIVSSAMLLSHALDEVDWEMLSGQPNNAQSNYFGKNDTSTYDRGGNHAMPNNQQAWHIYRIDWTPEYLAWSIDGNVVRTLLYKDAKGGARFPQTPMRIKVGAWAAGDPTNNAPGVVAWAGGPTDWNAGPFVMSVESIKIVNYTPAKEFAYSDNSGSYQSIKVIGGTLMSNGAKAPPPPPPPANPAPPTSVVAPPQPTATLKITGSVPASAPLLGSSTTTSAGKVTSTATSSTAISAKNATLTSGKPAVYTGSSAPVAILGPVTVLSAIAMSMLLLW